MEIATTPPCNAFRALNSIGKRFKDNTYSDELLAEIDINIQYLANYMGVTSREAFIFSIVFWLYCNGEHSGVSFSDISIFLNSEIIDVVAYQPEFNLLTQKNILEKERSRRGPRVKILNYSYSVSTELVDAIISNASMPECPAAEPMDIYQFVKTVSDYIEDRSNDAFNTRELFQMVGQLEDENPDLIMVKQVVNMGMGLEDRTLWYEICDDMVNGSKTSLESTMNDIYKSAWQRMRKSSELLERKNKLFELDWIELQDGGFVSNASIVLTDKGREIFMGEDAVLFLKKTKENKLITPDKIGIKTLYFDENLERQVNFIRQSLDETMFENLQSRLDAKGLPRGMSAIFYGGPGTGKTESVYQLARQTGRSILHVDISQSKSMWFGESEKRIKEIFTNYKALCKTESLKPILLFNEADAIFGKRKDNNASSVAQTENAIQNIILEEMEKLDGILIATTNLNKNLDAAFERRFLFKVQFEKPTLEAKQKIWLSKIDWLSEAEAGQLATNYSFSGGEIENIVRKATMEEVLTGEKPTFDQLMTYCENEKFSSTSGVKKLGFQ